MVTNLRFQNKETVLSAKVTTRIAYVVVTVWVISFVADLLIKEYDVPSSVQGAMMLVVGAAFTRSIVERGNGHKNGKSFDNLQD